MVGGFVSSWNKFHESGRGLGHVTVTIFGSTVGYPSDSLASCCNIRSFLWCFTAGVP